MVKLTYNDVEKIVNAGRLFAKVFNTRAGQAYVTPHQFRQSTETGKLSDDQLTELGRAIATVTTFAQKIEDELEVKMSA